MSMRPTLKLYALGVLSLFLFYGCSSSSNVTSNKTNTIPDWVESPGNEFSEAKYLMAVGAGNTFEEARRNALSSLSAIFRSEIKSTSEVISEFTQTSTANNELYSSGTTQLLNNVKIGTKQELMNTEILKSEVGGNGTYYALAGMDRMESSSIYTQEIDNNQHKIETLLTRAEESNDVLSDLSTLKQALVLAKVNENLAQQLNIINSGMADTKGAASTLASIQEEFDNTKKIANVKLSPNHTSQTVNSAITEIFQREGFGFSGDENNSVIEVIVDFTSQKADLRREDAEFVNWELIIEMIDLKSNRSFKTFTANGRDGAFSVEDAMKRADFSAKKAIETDFKQFLQQQLLAQN